MGLLALLLAERTVIGTMRPSPPILLLDDVMSELDRDRRAALEACLHALVATDAAHELCGGHRIGRHHL